MSEQRIKQLKEQIEEAYNVINMCELRLLVCTNPIEESKLKLDIEGLQKKLDKAESELVNLISGNSKTTAVPKPSNSDKSRQVASSKPVRNKVFISYSDNETDKKWLERIKKHLKPLESDGILEIWDRTRIKPSMNTQDERKKALATTKVAVLLLSADYLASDFYHNDLSVLNEGVPILLVYVSSCDLRDSELSELQPVNSPSKPLTSTSGDRSNSALVNLKKHIEGIFKA